MTDLVRQGVAEGVFPAVPPGIDSSSMTTPSTKSRPLLSREDRAATAG
ncbi:MAG: hypothetical protein ABI336_06315 [Humibacillus sp.]